MNMEHIAEKDALARRGELREAAFKCEGGLSAWYRRGILDALEALEAAERDADLARGDLIYARHGEEALRGLRNEWMARAERAEAALGRVRAVAHQWDGEPNLPPAAYNLVDDIRAALNGEPA